MALFGTDGVRGIANVDLTAELAVDLAIAAAHVLGEIGAFAGHRPKAIVGQDSRASGDFLESAIVAGLTSAGVDVYRVGVLPTPAIAYLVKESNADLGVMISASHNPMPDNGIKFFAKGGDKLADIVEAQIESRLGEPWDRPVGLNVGRIVQDESAKERYIKYLLSTITENLNGLKVVVDCANGAASYVAPVVYEKAGAKVTAISAAPTGWNINENCGSTHLDDLIAQVKATGADIGVGIEKTAVGDRYVLERMLENSYNLGGEQSGHVIMRDFSNTGDGLLTALQVMQIMAKTHKTLINLSSNMQKYPQVLINVKDVEKDKLTANQVIQEAIINAEKELAGIGRVLIRASGTESLVRVMVEANELQTAQKIAESLAQLVRLELK